MLHYIKIINWVSISAHAKHRSIAETPRHVQLARQIAIPLLLRFTSIYCS